MSDLKDEDSKENISNQLTRDYKRETLYIWHIVLWLASLLYFNPRLLALTNAAPNIISKLAVIVFTLCLDFFWLFMLYHALMISFSIRIRKKKKPLEIQSSNESPQVAILYPTRNDFRQESVKSCLEQDYCHHHVFILDDSTVEETKNSIDEWASQHVDKVTVIRREKKEGYKAGNLNYTLKQIKDDYPYFAICDADGILPRNFIKELLPFMDNKKVAYVQSCQEGNPNQKETFGEILSHMVGAHYRYYVEAKNYYGFVMFYGHGGLLKTSVWQEVGGFPEIATEDLAYSTKVRELGYQGIYTDQVVCFEDFPPSFAQLRKRSEKWIRGTSEFLKLYFGSFLKSKNVSWYEKLDVFIGSISHYQSAVMLIFLLMLGTLLPTYFDHFRYPGSFFLMPVPEGKSVWEYLIHMRYHIFWSFDFYTVMILTVICPFIPQMIDLFKKPIKMLKHIVLTNFVFLGSLVVETWDFLVFLFTGKAIFRNTLDESSGNQNRDAGEFYHPNHKGVFLSEWVFSVILFCFCWQTKNLWFAAPAVALLISPMMCWKGMSFRLNRWLCFIPFLVTFAILSLVTLDLVVMVVTIK